MTLKFNGKRVSSSSLLCVDGPQRRAPSSRHGLREYLGSGSRSAGFVIQFHVGKQFRT